MDNDVVHIIKKDEATLKIKCERHIAQELSDHFSFFVPGFQFVPSFRSKIWDGKIRLFSIQTYEIYHGLIGHIEKFCESRGYIVTYSDPEISFTEDFSVYHAEKFISTLNLPKKYSVHQHQLEAFIHAIRQRRTTLVSPTASGKSLIIYLIVRQILNYRGKKGLIIVPTTSLVAQLSKDFEDYGWNIDENVHQIFQGKAKTTNKPLVISTWQSLYTMPPEYLHQFDFVLGDECHLAKAKSLTTILSNAANARYRVGLTGTLDGTKTHRLVIEGLFGPVRQVVTTTELMDKKLLSDFEIKCLVLKHNEDSCKLARETKSYELEIKMLIESEARNKFIKNLALSLPGTTLLLYQYVDKHGKILYDIIKSSENIGDRPVYLIHGKISTEERELYREEIIKGNNSLVIASFGTYSTGINIPNIDNVIFASPSKSRIRNLQSIGRALRLSNGKKIATLYDISDDLRIDKYTNHTLKHFSERLEIYNAEKFKFKIYKIQLKK